MIHPQSESLIAIILVIQLVGSLGAWLFSRLSRKKGNRYALIVMNIIWIGVCVGAYLTQDQFQFYALAVVVGMVMGGIQSLSRATYSKLIPGTTKDHASYFSFYDVTFNMSIVVGTFSYGLVDHITGDMRYSALFLGLYFIVGLIFLLNVRIIRDKH